MEFTFKVTEQEANILVTALQELPAKVANPLTQKLQKQAQEQIQAEQAIVKEEPEAQ